MTPKEKAKELIDSFLITVSHETWDKVGAAICAKKVCDELIKQLEELCKPEYTSFWHGEKAGETVDGYELKDYWQDVKTEIEKL